MTGFSLTGNSILTLCVCCVLQLISISALLSNLKLVFNELSSFGFYLQYLTESVRGEMRIIWICIKESRKKRSKQDTKKLQSQISH